MHRHGTETHNLQPFELSICADSVEHWVNHWAWTYDPRENPDGIKSNRVLPFDLFPRQEEYLAWLREREQNEEDGLVEKSRDMGVTWLCCAYAAHGWLFRDGYSVGFGSLKWEEVDELGNLDTILEKCRFLIRGLPAWMQPAGYIEREHASYCRIVNPANGAIITGEGGDEMGRGGRKSVFFLDEAARVARPQKVDAALSQTTRVRIDVSTPRGPGNSFAQRRFSGRVPVFTFHWRQDPRKSEAWYAAQKADSDPIIIAQELDIDYGASIEGITIPAAWVRAAVDLALPRSGYAVGGLDVAEDGDNRSVLTTRRGPVISPPIDWGHCNTTQTAHRAIDACDEDGVQVLAYDCIGVGAGVRGTLESSGRPLRFGTMAVNVGAAPTLSVWPDGRTSKERFINLRAELWWHVRMRFERAYEFVEHGVPHEPEDMISIPNDPRLIADLSMPLHSQTDTGKIRIESKDSMRRRGVKSPDFADSIILTFAPLVLGADGTPEDDRDMVLSVG